MAPKQSKPARPPSGGQSQQLQARKPLLDLLALPAALLTLAALASPASQATLAPVFGSIPSSINHSQAIAATPLLGFLWRWQFKNLPKDAVIGYLAVWAFWVPVISAYLFRYSGSLGIVSGPILIGFLSCHTIIIAASYAAAEALEDLHLEDKVGPFTAPLLLALLGDLHVVSFSKFFSTLLPAVQTLTSVLTPVKTQALIASSLAYFSHSKLALLGIPALIHTFSANPHFDSTRTLNNLNTTLHNEGNWSILARQWSNTGYISVLEDTSSAFRIMRADHSLLGGEWLATPHRREKEGWKGNEPIYAVFEMLEAVRLVPTEPEILDAEAQALVVGLGIGTAPKAFLAHGINTTVIELDPAVHEYAVDYFDLPENHTSIIQDAVGAVRQLQPVLPAQDERGRYDYIIHDVFTGGAEPLSLFTLSFLTDLRSLLRPNGVVAINYAGNPASPLTQKVLRTIRSVFGESCRAFRDSEPAEDGAEQGKSGAETEEDIMKSFANMVIFCRHPSHSHRHPHSDTSQRTPSITFRAPTQADFLGRKSAQRYLLPNPKFELLLPGAGQGASLKEEDLLLESELDDWTAHQTQSAIRHWVIMRKVLPDFVWELW